MAGLLLTMELRSIRFKRGIFVNEVKKSVGKRVGPEEMKWSRVW